MNVKSIADNGWLVLLWRAIVGPSLIAVAWLLFSVYTAVTQMQVEVRHIVAQIITTQERVLYLERSAMRQSSSQQDRLIDNERRPY